MGNNDEVILEGAWDCAQCREKGIPGHLFNCPTCGDPRNPLLDPSEAPYLPDDAQVVTDAAQLKQARSGAQWNCGHCGQGNLGTAKVCSDCGRPIDGLADVQPVLTYVTGEAARGVHLDDPTTAVDDRTDTVLRQADPLQEIEIDPVKAPDRTYAGSALPTHGKRGTLYGPDEPDVPSTSRPRWRRPKFLAIVAGAVLALVGLVAGGVVYYSDNIATHPVNLKVQSVAWQRQIGIDTDKTFTLSGWTVPYDGRVISSHLAIRSYVRVVDHYVTKTRQVSSQVPSGTKTVKTPCGSTKKSLGNGHYSSTTKYCNSTVTKYKTVYHTQSYQVPVYRQKPIYAMRYTYQITRWVLDHYVTASGTTNPYWPTPDNKGVLQREGSERTQSYTVVVTDPKGVSHTESIPENTWAHVRQGETLKGAETHGGDLRSVTWPTS